MNQSKISHQLLMAFSLAALSFFPIWSTTLDSKFYFDYPQMIFDPIFFLVVLFWMVIWTGIITIILRSSSNPFLYFLQICVVGLCLLIAGNLIRFELGITRKAVGFYALAGMGFLCFALVIYLGIKYKNRFWIILQNILIVLSPFAFLVTAKTIWNSVEQTKTPNFHPASVKSLPGAPRVLWMIFDEMDIRFAFEHQGNLSLPNLDHLKSHSLFAIQAYAAESDTLHSIPAMFSGLNLINPTILNNHNVKFLHVDTQTTVTWKEIPNIFMKAKELDLKTAILGNYHPYHKLFGNEVDYCLPSCIPEMSLSTKFSRYTRLLFHTITIYGIPLVYSYNLLSEEIIRQQFIDSYQHMLEKARLIVSNPEYNFIFIHWTIPHLPGIYNASTKKFEQKYPANYIDNLALVDDTLGKLYQDMHNAGIWDDTTVIVTSDHWLRAIKLEKNVSRSMDTLMKNMMPNPDYRVPLLIKMAHQKEPTLHSEKFRMFHIHDMLEHILNGSIKSTHDLSNWMKSMEPQFTMEGLEKKH